MLLLLFRDRKNRFHGHGGPIDDQRRESSLSRCKMLAQTQEEKIECEAIQRGIEILS